MDANLKADLPALPIGTKIEGMDAFKYAGRMDMLLGGSLEDVPERYKMAAPITHVNSETPPSLFLQGTTDVLVPVEPTEKLFKKLVEAAMQAVKVIFPMTDHMFEFLFSQISPQSPNGAV